MKNLTLAIALMLLVPMAAEAQKIGLLKTLKSTSKNVVAEQGRGQTYRTAARKAASDATLLPRHEQTYYYEDGEWVEDGTFELEYDSRGKVVQQTESYGDGATMTTCEYDENGMETSKIVAEDDGEGNFVNSSMLLKQYDGRVTSLTTSSLEYTWQDGDWQMISAGRTWRRDVSRDSKENVTAVSLSTYYNGDFEETYRSSIGYGDDGKATIWKYEELGYDATTGTFTMNPVYTFSNIEWKNTNGQIVNFETTDFFVGDNRISAATVTDEEDGAEQQLTASYEENGNYTYRLTCSNPVFDGTCYYTVDDSNGSYTMYAESANDTNCDGIIDEQDEVYTEKVVVKYDEHGNITEETSYDDGSIASALKYEYVYGNADSDYPTEQIHYEYDADADEYVPFIKVVSTDFIDVTDSIRTIDAASASHTSVYNMQGIRLGDNAENLPSGLYIVRNGGHTSKILKK